MIFQSGEDDMVAPCGSLVSPPFSHSSKGSHGSHNSFSSEESLPIVTPSSSPVMELDTYDNKPLFA